MKDETSPYGFCPTCGGVGRTRERRLDGNDRCENGHVYPSRNSVKTTLEHAQQPDLLRARLRKVAQILVEAVGAEGPMDAEEAAQKAVQRIENLNELLETWSHKAGTYAKRMMEAQKSRDDTAVATSALLRELNDLFEWKDESLLHAVLHVRNAVLNLRADLRTERFLRETERKMSESRGHGERAEIVAWLRDLSSRTYDTEGLPYNSHAASLFRDTADAIERGYHRRGGKQPPLDDATCGSCGHSQRRHDPEDGNCEAHAEVGLGRCPCDEFVPNVELKGGSK